MKMNSLKAAAAFGLTVLLANTAAAQNSAASSPVGYETLNYSTGFNFVGLRLLGAEQGTSAIDTINGALITLDGSFADGDYIVEVSSGAGNGITVTGSVTNGNMLTTDSDISVGADAIDADSLITLRTPQNLISAFGDPATTSLTVATNASGADQIWVPDGSGDFERYFVFGIPGNTNIPRSWRNVASAGADIDGADVDLIYSDGIVIVGAGQGSVVITGSVKTTPTDQVVSPGFNFLGNVYPAGSNLVSLFGAASDSELTVATNASGADQVWIPDGSGDFNRYFVFGIPGNTNIPRNWRDVANPSVALDNPESILIEESGYVLLSAASEARSFTTAPPSFYANL